MWKVWSVDERVVSVSAYRSRYNPFAFTFEQISLKCKALDKSETVVYCIQYRIKSNPFASTSLHISFKCNALGESKKDKLASE